MYLVSTTGVEKEKQAMKRNKNNKEEEMKKITRWYCPLLS